MGKLNEPRIEVIVESYYPSSTAGLHGKVHIRPVAGQGFSQDMHVRCNKDLKNIGRFPVGTKFRILAMLTDNTGGTQYLSSHPTWDFEVVA